MSDAYAQAAADLVSQVQAQITAGDVRRQRGGTVSAAGAPAMSGTTPIVVGVLVAGTVAGIAWMFWREVWG